MRLVDVGNIVKASDATGLLVITQLRPINVLFTLPQQQLPQINKSFAQGPLTVEAFANDNKTVADRGVLRVVDNQIDQATGTIKLKAEFPNLDLQLWPGQFVNVRLLVDTLKDVVVAPTASVQRGPNGTFVYVVRDDDTVAMRPITISLQDENLTVIPTGVQAGERIVTTSFNQLADGRKVSVSMGEPGAAPAPPGANRRGPAAEDGAAQAAPSRERQRRSERTEGTTRTP
jgi:multidrug efflux system membrane fusion protein